MKHNIYVIKTRSGVKNPRRTDIRYNEIFHTGLFEGYSKKEAIKKCMEELDNAFSKITREGLEVNHVVHSIKKFRVDYIQSNQST